MTSPPEYDGERIKIIAAHNRAIANRMIDEQTCNYWNAEDTGGIEEIEGYDFFKVFTKSNLRALYLAEAEKERDLRAMSFS